MSGLVVVVGPGDIWAVEAEGVGVGCHCTRPKAPPWCGLMWNFGDLGMRDGRGKEDGRVEG